MQEKAEYLKILRFEETCWRQKSRVAWLKGGDRNMTFFHKMAFVREKSNFIA